MAPSKRADNKKMIGVYLDEKVIKRFQEACAFFGVTMSQVLTAYITDKVNDYERTLRKQSVGRVAENSGESDRENSGTVRQDI